MNRVFRITGIFVLLVLWSTVLTGFAHGDTMRVAVSPFDNSGPNRDSDYLGFQIAEFLSSSFASFPDIQVVERGQLQRVFQEQQLQLSGVTDTEDTVQLGRILNARQIVVGSFHESPTRMSITARIVDSQTGGLLSSGTVEAPRSDSYGALYRTLFVELISRLPAYEMTIPVEATLDSIDRQAQQASQNYARALQALFENDDEAALRYLRESIAGEDVDIVRFDELAREYSEVLERTEGATIYTQMIQRQIAHNRTLTEQIDPLNLYRSTLRVLADRVAAQIVPERFTIEADTASQDEWEIGTVSVSIPVPQNISVSLNDDTISRIAALVGEQDIVSLQDDSMQIRRPPSGRLLNSRALNDLFRLGWEARIGYAIEFLGSGGEVLFRLTGEPIPVVTIGEKGIQYSEAARGSLVVDSPADGWRLRENGTVEVQSRNLRNLASLRVVIDPDLFHLDYGFMLYQDIHWQSLITHAYRINSVKIDTGERDSAPAFKEVIISDSRFFTGDRLLDPVPILPRERRIAPFARPTAYVYMADEVSGTINGVWQGQSDPEPITGRFTDRDVLAFDYPYSTLNAARVRFTATFQDSRSTASVLTENPVDTLLSRGNRITTVTADRERVYLGSFNTIRAYNARFGRELWSTRLDQSARPGQIVSDGNALHTSSGVTLDATSGRELWNHRSHDTTRMTLARNLETILSSYRGTTIARESSSGVERWRYEGNIGISSVFAANGLYRKLEDPNNRRQIVLWSYDPFTGEALRRLHTLDVEFSRSPGLLDAADGILLAEAFPTLHAFDTATNEELWAFRYWDGTEEPRDNVDRWPVIQQMTVHNGIVFLVSISASNVMYVSALDLISGRELWRTSLFDRRTDVFAIETDGTWVYVNFNAGRSGWGTVRNVSALHPATGRHAWTSLVWPTPLHELNATLAVEEAGDQRAYLMNSSAMPHFQTPMHRIARATREAEDASADTSSEAEKGAPRFTSRPLSQEGRFLYWSLGGGLGALNFIYEEYDETRNTIAQEQSVLETYFFEATVGRGKYERDDVHEEFLARMWGLEAGLGFLGNVSDEDADGAVSAPSVFYITGRLMRTFHTGGGGFGFGAGINYFLPALEVTLPDNTIVTSSFVFEPLARAHLGRVYLGLSVPIAITDDETAVGISLIGGIGSFHFRSE